MGGCSIAEHGGAFIFQCLITEEYLRRAVRAMRPRWRSVLFWFFGVLAAVGLLSLLQVISLFNDFMSGMLILYAVLFVCLQAQGERRSVRQILERCCACEPADVEREYTFGEEILVYAPVTGSRKQFSYREVKGFRSTRAAYLLLLNGVTLVYVPKACFVQGQDVRFEQFLRERLNG